MTYSQLISRTRSYLRDFTGSIFREVDLTNYANEGVDRIRQVIPELRDMPYVLDGQPILLLPEYMQYLLAVYSASRCFAQDENNYRSGLMQNEFESKLQELKEAIETGEITIVDSEGEDVAIIDETSIDNVVDVYYVASYTENIDETEPIM